MGVCRMRTESLAGPSPRTGKRISDVRDERPQSASGRSSFPAETANGPLHPPQTAENRGYSAETGNSGLAQDCVVALVWLAGRRGRLLWPVLANLARRLEFNENRTARL